MRDTNEMKTCNPFAAIDVRRSVAALTCAVMLAACDSAPSAAEHYQRASEAHARGDVQGAVIALKSALQAEPEMSEARLLLGKVYVSVGDGAAARGARFPGSGAS